MLIFPKPIIPNPENSYRLFSNGWVWFDDVSAITSLHKVTGIILGIAVMTTIIRVRKGYPIPRVWFDYFVNIFICLGLVACVDINVRHAYSDDNCTLNLALTSGLGWCFI